MRKGILLLVGLVSLSSWALGQVGGLSSFQNAETDSLLAARSKAREDREKKTGNYGAHTTRFTFEENFKFNNIQFVTPDTIPDNLHRFGDLERSGYLIQNLGNIGTARRSLFFEPSKTIGRTSGYSVYDDFYTSPDQIKYYDTRSPYTDVFAAFGGGGRAVTDVTFALNDSVQFNIGFNFNSIRSDKQLAFLTRGDRQVKNNDWNIFGFLRPKRLPKYLLLFNMTQLNHEVSEQGGIIDPSLDTSNPDASFFDYQDANVILDDAFSKDKRGGFHIYQQYDLDSIFQVYHTFNYLEQITRFDDSYTLTGSDSLLYESVGGETSGTIAQRTTFRELLNEFGLKGRTKKFSYTLLYKNRLLSYDVAQIENKVNETEHYLGGTLRQQLTPKIFLTASGELLLGGNYFAEGRFTSDFFDATYSRINNKPSFLVERFEGEQRQWTNTFENQISDNFQGTIKLKSGNISFRPFVKFNRISNYTYFDENRLAAQATDDVVLLAPGFHLDWKISDKWFWSSSIYYNNVSGGSASTFRIPETMALAQIAYKNVLFDGKMIVQTGMDVHFRSGYFGQAYDPTSQQFYLQNSFKQDGFAKIDLFLNFKVKTFLFFVKSAHFNQGLTNDGYFITPLFTGTRQTLDMGVRWSFYD
ncbi:putative porin [Roseivirga sp. E12]|uniref:putative porin n=1 Tax=Roseivirga sp. E12 TaxID=2819237 RepID=UPI00351C233E